ncbi:hypothetical protein KP77_11840 [Jeotgalibacillus alimentarius]|uniref:Uncharacterized protein n=1 Tax=Jeotgalibacillus alimentarius TaxID=135826 RepID=A0A0C2VRW8_9BACL|nr:hypothetical protein KP77_11840 [Jeotgalibacillus alimentarius]
MEIYFLNAGQFVFYNMGKVLQWIVENEDRKYEWSLKIPHFCFLNK